MTDHALLNVVEDKYHCLIIDKVHERSAHTDLILASVNKIYCTKKTLEL